MGNGFQHPETTRTWDALYYGDPLSVRFYDCAIPLVLELLKARPGDLVLDAGCGAGVHSIRAARAGCRVDAIDFSEAALKDAQGRVAESGLQDRIRLAQDDLTHLKIPDAAHDRVFSWGVLIHIPEIEKALDELVRILAPGGRLALYISNSTALQLRAVRLKRWLQRKPSRLVRHPLGLATHVDLHGESIWVWYNDVPAVIRWLEARGLRTLHRSAGEFTDCHLRFRGALRRAFFRLNNAWTGWQLPASMAHMNLLVFEKPVGAS